ncbi:hypothetical protein [Treponema sp.]|uniref:hypothetical protein n=1 Tax=Treponema sp. TaxID=166 RepID=UPI00298DC5F9|nr:hypothetical protein [Treponema sp.]MCR5612482.1 hypothetical protein [Treponema sp.]
MKKSFLSIFVLLFICSFSFSETKINVIKRCFTSDTVTLRMAPAVHAKKIVEIPKHTVVYIIAEGQKEIIYGKTLQWKKIIADQFKDPFNSDKKYEAGKTGWVLTECLTEDDIYTDDEIEKILAEYSVFNNSWASRQVHGFSFLSPYEGNDKRRILAYSDDYEMPGCFEDCGETTYHVKDGKIFIDKPFETGDDDHTWANTYFDDNGSGQTYMMLVREHSTKGEYCLVSSYDDWCSDLKSEPVHGSLILEDGVLFSSDSGTIVLPCDCLFYESPSFDSGNVSFPDFINIEEEDVAVLVYNLDRAFKNQLVSYSRYIVNTETRDGITGRWYYLDSICNTDGNHVWIFVPEETDPPTRPVNLTVQTFADAAAKGILNYRVLSDEDVELISNTHHHMNPWIDSCLDTFPAPEQ